MVLNLVNGDHASSGVESPKIIEQDLFEFWSKPLLLGQQIFEKAFECAFCTSCFSHIRKHKDTGVRSVSAVEHVIPDQRRGLFYLVSRTVWRSQSACHKADHKAHSS